MKVNLVTLFALRGDAYMWCSSWKQGNQNITWEKFERAFIKKFIPDLWEMMEAAEEVSREEIQKVKTEIDDDLEKEKLQVKNAEKVIESESSNRYLQRHKESVALFDTPSEKIETDYREASVKINQVGVVDSLPPEPSDADLRARTLPESKPPDLEAETDNVELNNHRHGMPRPPSKPPESPDTDPLAVIFPQPVPQPKPPDWDVSEEEGGLRAGSSPSKPPGRREFPLSSPNHPTWYPSISPTATEPFDPGDVASVIGHVRVTGVATTTSDSYEFDGEER
jgi:hypothetical protein